MASNCSEDNKLFVLLYENFASNNSMWTDALSEETGCQNGNSSGNQFDNLKTTELDHTDQWIENLGKDIYAFATPIIALIGLIDNILSLIVFMSKFMRRLSSTCYLATLSVCHILILLTYVSMDWLHKGLERWPGNKSVNLMRYPVGCHIFLYMSYTFRFASVWLIVAFAVERYVVICYPQYRRAVCARPFAKKVTLITLICAGLFSAYKPALSGVYKTKDPSAGSDAYSVCVGNPDYRHLNFLMDSVYVILITALPSFIISALSVPILQKFRPKRSAKGAQRIIFKEHRIRLELTVILLAIAWCFIFLTLPYFVTWCLQFFQSLQHNLPIQGDTAFFFDVFSGKIAITRAVYYLNFATNFFLYCLTGAHYRRQVRSILLRRYHSYRSSISDRKGTTPVIM